MGIGQKATHMLLLNFACMLKRDRKVKYIKGENEHGHCGISKITFSGDRFSMPVMENQCWQKTPAPDVEAGCGP